MTIAFGLSGSLADTLANRPAPDLDKIGRFFLDTDAGTLYRDSGTAWLRVRNDATDRPRGGSLIIQTNDAHALQVCSLISSEEATFDEETADPSNLVAGYEGLTGVASTNSNSGTLYFDVEKYGAENPLWRIVVYSAADRNPESMVAVTSWSHISETVTVVEINTSGLGGTLSLTGLTESTGQISAHWTIETTVTPVEIFNVNTLTGAVTIPQLSTPSTAMVTNFNAEFVGGKRAAELGGSGGDEALPLDSYLLTSMNTRNDEWQGGPGLDGKWSLVGNALDRVNVNSDCPGLLLLRRNDTGYLSSVIYQDVPSAPFTVYTKLKASGFSQNYCRGGGIMLLPASPSDSSQGLYIGACYENGRNFDVLRYSDLASWGGSLFGTEATSTVIWLRADVLAGGTTVDVYYSLDGYLWHNALAAIALGFTCSNAGISIAPTGQNSTTIALFGPYRVSG